MGQNDVEHLLQAVPINDYIGRVVSLKRRGSNYIGLCPFHSEKTPSFTVSPDRGIFKCFGCGKGGNVITFVQEYEKVSFREALEILARYAGIELKGYVPNKGKQEKEKHVYSILEWVATLYQKNLHTADVSRYLKERKVDEKSVSHFRLGYAPDNYHFLEQQVQNSFQNTDKIQAAYAILLELGLLGRRDDGGYFNRFRDRLMFPILNNQKQVVGFGGRQLTKNEKSAKYINSNDSAFFNKKNILFHFSSAIEEARKNKYMIVVEGYFDVLGLYQKGLENVVASMGTAFTPEHAQLIKRYCDLSVLFFDSDSAGIDAALKSFSVCKNAGLAVRVVTSHVGKKEKADPFDLSTQLDTFNLYALIDSAKNEEEFILWYFFSYKYNITMLEQKQVAIENFFALIASFKAEWEKEEYLKKAAELLKISAETLVKDFRKGKVVESVTRKQKRAVTQNENLQKRLHNSEKDFIAILLLFPDFWAEEKLLEQMRWQSNELFLLYSFFRDRIKVGEDFSIHHSIHQEGKEDEQKNGVANISAKLPLELSSIFSDIVMLIDKNNEINSETNSKEQAAQNSFPETEDKEKHYKMLRAIIWRSCIEYYKQRSNDLKMQLEESEREAVLSGDDTAKENEIEKLYEERENAISDQKKYKDLLEKEQKS